MSLSLEQFISRWAASGAAERANKDSFLRDLCDVLDVPHPDPTTGDSNRDRYVFEKDALLPHEGGTTTVGKIDLYKHDCFILEAKQGSESGAKKLGTAKRETPAWNVAMKDAYGQAIGYARAFDKPVPFLVVADLGYCFDLYASFDGSWDYRPFPNARSNRLFLKDLATHKETLKKLFIDPRDLDPSKHAAKVTREIAGYLANLAKKLEADKHPPEAVATFLMRCLFTMFAEDVGLLPDGAFTKALRDFWIPSPKSFPGSVEQLWRTMNEGGDLFGVVGKILRFNGGLFAAPSALPLDEHALRLLLLAAECDWSGVEPAIFGTLLERALDPKERHRLGAHFTPRAYVERLVRPTIEEPLRAEWEVVQAQVRKLVSDAHDAKSEKDAKKKTKDAANVVKEFHKKLTTIRVLDPACGSGNFLYVTLDLFKRLEGEVLATLEGLGEHQELLHMESVRVTPQQFLGIEIKRWAKEIAELVLWIGYLQWHFRMYGKGRPVPEPVLHDYKNIECRDAVLAYDSEELVRDETTGKPITRWDGATMKKSVATGEDIPNESAQLPLYRYVNPRKANWPDADFIVGNPPFIGSKRMRDALGDGYVDALRTTYETVPDGADYVVYWWSRAAEQVATSTTKRFGLITTNSITQSMNRRVVEQALAGDSSLGILWAIPDHPWVDSASGAAVRIAMTVFGPLVGASIRLLSVQDEESAGDDEVRVNMVERPVARIHSDLSGGASVVTAKPLAANRGICSVALVRFGEGFVVSEEVARRLEKGVVFPLLTGRDVNQTPSGNWVIDFFPLSEEESMRAAPKAFQHVIEHVKPGRDQIRDPGSRARWWRFGRDKPELRAALANLPRYIATSEVSKHRAFVFVPSSVRPDHSLIVVASADAYDLGVLSSRVHTCWALASGGTLEDRPRYNKSVCFDPFPFPVCADKIRARVAQLAESLDAHRKARQAEHPELTITGMYNSLEKLKAGTPFTAKEKAINEHGLISVLRKIHDDLDAAVFDAYGWPRDLTDEQILERLVALNGDRAEEEKRGVVRWLRPDVQNPPSKVVPMKQVDLIPTSKADDENSEPASVTANGAPATWPKKLAEQIGAVRDLVTKSSAEWSAEDVVANFKGAKVGDVTEVLDSLGALGLLVTYELVEGRRWRSAAFVSVRPPAV